MKSKMSNNKKFVVEANFIENAVRLNLSLSEFLLLLYFENDDEGVFDLEKISHKLKVDKNIIMEAFNNLISKKLIDLKNEKDLPYLLEMLKEMKIILLINILIEVIYLLGDI